jgi:protein-S-isoprenylcysteine O-methyltransferase Ste14
LSAFAILTGFFMIRSEERELAERFGELYERYRRSVPALIPRF